MGTITFVAVLWCYLNHLRVDFGPFLFGVTATHGVHLDDLVFLAVEFVLLCLLTSVLVVGFAGAQISRQPEPTDRA